MSKESQFESSHRWRILAIGVAANASFAAAFAGIPTTAVFMRSGYRLDTGDLGLVLSALAAAAVLASIVFPSSMPRRARYLPGGPRNSSSKRRAS
jgi:hypothetical protein